MACVLGPSLTTRRLRSVQPRRSVWRLAMAMLLLACLAPACLHDWDALDPEEGDTDAATLCASYCDAYDTCVAPADMCLSDCETRTANCSTKARETLAACVADVNADCGDAGADIAFLTCVSLVGCWSDG